MHYVPGMSTSPATQDIEKLRTLLAEIEKPASLLQWARENPNRAWTVKTHTAIERGVVTVDLHDLGQKLSRRILSICEKAGPELHTGAVRFVTGRGRNSVTGPVLREVVGNALLAQCKRHGWNMHAEGGARFILIIDSDKAPKSATGALEWPILAGGAAFLALTLFLAPWLGVGLCTVAFFIWLSTR